MSIKTIYSSSSNFVPYYEQNSTLREQLIHFCKSYCPGLTVEEMFARIQRGQEIESVLAKKDIENIVYSLDSAVNLMWWFTAKAAYYGDLHLQGAFRLDQGEIVFEFLKQCAGKNLYERISTHLNENIPLVKKSKGTNFSLQYGFDILENILPSGKHAFLFALQPDDSLYIKLEEHGTPPFWKWNFCTVSNAYTTTLHCVDWWNSHGRSDFGEGMRDCREGTMGRFKQRFAVVLKKIHPNPNGDNDLDPPKELLKTIARGHQFGLSMMHKILTEEYSDEAPSKTDLLNDLECVLERARSRGYMGQIKGSEVTLPPLGHLQEIPDFF